MSDQGPSGHDAARIKRALKWTGAALFLFYLFASTRYYYLQTHLFDPFLQVPPQAYDQFLRPDPAVFKVLCIGGSTTENDLLPEPARYPSFLGRALKERYPGKKLDVINAGKQFYSAKNSLINYVTNADALKPQAAVIMHAVNDLYRSFSPPPYAMGGYNDLWSHYYGAAINGADPPTFERYAYQRLRQELAKLRIPLPEVVGRSQAVDMPLERFVSLAMYRKNLARLIKRVRADGAKVFVVIEPYLYKDEMTREEVRTLWFGPRLCVTRKGPLSYEFPSHKSLARAMRAYDQAGREVALENGAVVIEGEAALPKTLEYFTDDVHYTPKGAEMVARAVADGISKSRVIDGYFAKLPKALRR